MATKWLRMLSLGSIGKICNHLVANAIQYILDFHEKSLTIFDTRYSIRTDNYFYLLL